MQAQAPAIVPATITDCGITVSVKPDPMGDGFDFLVSINNGKWEPEEVYPQIDCLSIRIDAKQLKF